MTAATDRGTALPWVLTAGVVVASAAILLTMGRSPICPCGYVLFWSGDVHGVDNSQHLFDWYTPSHVIHGFLFYWLLSWAAPRLSFGWRLTVATLIEAAWEVLENSPQVVDRYRTVTVSVTYAGDSVLNSTADILAMMAGFALAARLPVAVTVALAIGFEVVTTLVIRDGLVLNVLMFLWPVEAVVRWQAGG